MTTVNGTHTFNSLPLPMSCFHTKRMCILLLGLLLIPTTLTSAFNFQPTSQSNKKATTLPKLDPQNPERYIPPSTYSSTKLYPPTDTLVRAGPLPFLIRLVQSDKYEQAVLKYMYDSKTSDLKNAQGNMDWFFKAPDVWVEQKMLEQQGKREVYDYGKDPEPLRLVLSLVWASCIAGLGGRVAWQLIHGNRNLF